MRVYLSVGYDEKDRVKTMGARWSPFHKSWYVENVDNLEDFSPWIAKNSRRIAMDNFNSVSKVAESNCRRH